VAKAPTNFKEKPCGGIGTLKQTESFIRESSVPSSRVAEKETAIIALQPTAISSTYLSDTSATI
jgi:hypothetical protein